jgi:hypothetical protein
MGTPAPKELTVHQTVFASVSDVQERLSAAGYLTDHAIATTVFLADRLGKPLLVRRRQDRAGEGGSRGDRLGADPPAVL